MPVILGFDCSLRATGIAVVASTPDSIVLEAREIVSSFDRKGPYGIDRLINIVRQVNHNLLLWKKRYLGLSDRMFDLVVFEGYAYAARGRVYEIAELGGLLKAVVYNKWAKCILVSHPMHVKIFVGCSGRDKKPAVCAGFDDFIARGRPLRDTKNRALRIGDVIPSMTHNCVDASILAMLGWEVMVDSDDSLDKLASVKVQKIVSKYAEQLGKEI